MRAGTCLELCSPRACMQKNPFTGQGSSFPTFSSSAPWHVCPAKEPSTGTGSNLEDCPFWLLYPDMLLPIWVSSEIAQLGVLNTPQVTNLHLDMDFRAALATSGWRSPRDTDSLRTGSQQSPVGHPVNLHLKPCSSKCLCFATQFIAESVFCPDGSQRLYHQLCICS